MTPAQQIELIRKMARHGVSTWLIRFIGVMIIGLLAGGLYTSRPSYFIFAAFGLAVALTVRQTTPHTLDAVKALDSGRRVKGTIYIAVTKWSDSSTYHATMQTSPPQKWRFEFIPLGWSPSEGHFEAVLFKIQNVDWPALVQVEQGILYPRRKPELQACADA